MRNGALTGAVAFAVALAGGTAFQAMAQEDAVPASVGTYEEDAEPLYSDDDLADLVAPIALYPDSLLTQVLVAATFPLEVVKAERFIAASADLTDPERADAAEAEDWDPSVVVLAAGFPTVVQRMAEELDWTEQLGDAMLVQTDDVLDAVQLMRARASAAGSLTSNEAQVVEVVDDAISIAPADPQIIYVPTYDTQTVYAAAPTTYATTPAAPVYTTVDDGYSTNNLLTTGAIAFGSAMLINEIFDDDDNDYNNNYNDDWDNYWRPGHNNIDWDSGDFNARPNINVDGDVNVNVSGDSVDIDKRRTKDVDRVRLESDGKWKPTADQKKAARDRAEARKDRERPTKLPAKNKAQKDSKDRDKIQAKLKDREGNANSSSARDKLKDASDKRKPRDPNKPGIADNRPGGDGLSNLSRPADRERPGKPGDKVRPGDKGKPADRAAIEDKLAQRDKSKVSDTAFKPHDRTPADIDRAKDRGSASAKDRVGGKDRPKVAAAKDPKKPRPEVKKADAKPSAFKPADKSAAKVRKAEHRGTASVSKERAKPKAAAPSKAVSKPKHAKPQMKKSPPKASAFKKPPGGGSKAKKSSSRGGKSAAKRKRN